MKKVVTNEIEQRLQNFCVYRDRSEYEIGVKLKNANLSDIEKEEIIENLKKEKFLDNRRFASSFATGKFHQNKWGKVKIRQALLQHNLDELLIENVLHEIPMEEYRSTLTYLLRMKMKRTSESQPLKLRAKLYNYATQKGYESQLIFKIMDEMDLVSDE